jgi:sulfonate transport system permease protein
MNSTQTDGRSIVRKPGRAERNPLAHRRLQRAQEIALAFGTPFLILLAWQLAAETGRIDTNLFPSPAHVLELGAERLRSADLYDELLLSLRRMFLGYALGVTAGLVIGVFMGMSRLVHASLDVLLSALYTVPKLALLPVFLIIFGIGETPLVLMIAVTVFFFMWIETMEAIRGVAPSYLEPILVFRDSSWQCFRHAIFPAALPRIFVGMKVSAAVSVLTLVAVEFLQASEGIGHDIWFSWSLFRADEMYFGIALVSIIGVIFTKTIGLISALVMPWTRRGVRGD